MNLAYIIYFLKKEQNFSQNPGYSKTSKLYITYVYTYTLTCCLLFCTGTIKLIIFTARAFWKFSHRIYLHWKIADSQRTSSTEGKVLVKWFIKEIYRTILLRSNLLILLFSKRIFSMLFILKFIFNYKVLLKLFFGRHT